MINRFRKLPILVRSGFAILILLTILWGLFSYYSYKESREHDRLPIILDSSIKMEIVNSNFYDNLDYRDGDICSQAEQKNILQLVSETEDDRYITCSRFVTDRGIFYWVDRNPTLQLVALEKPTGTFKIIINDDGDYADFKGYPGIYPFKMRGNSTDVVFIYKGWNNPRKMIRLSVN